MSQTLEPRTQRRLDWEWRVALITLAAGFAIACAAIAYIRIHAASQRAAEAATRSKQVAVVQTAELLCKQALATAKDFGIVPNYATLAAPLPVATQVTGRYVCSGGTNVSRYNIAVDLICRDLKSGRCLGLYSVTQQDGTVLYRRQR